MDKYGIIGYPLKHSFSPMIHNAGFKALGINALYEKYEIEAQHLNDKISQLKSPDFKGFNVTVPHKQRIMAFLDHIDPLAQKVGAVNTIKQISGAWYGYNSDVSGFILPIKKGLPSIKNTLIIGAGGAAKAVCFALLENAALSALTIVNRSFNKANLLKSELAQNYKITISAAALDIFESREKYDLIINTTSVGMANLKHLNPFTFTQNVHSESIIYDLIYNPKETLFLKNGCDLGLQTINGLEMLIGQAMESFTIWTGLPFPQEIIDHDLFYKNPA